MSRISQQKRRGFDFMLLLLVIVLGLLALFVTNQPVRMQAGGKASVIGLAVAAAVLVFLQRFVQDWMKEKSKERRREGERRFWREREAREKLQREYDLKKRGADPAAPVQKLSVPITIEQPDKLDVPNKSAVNQTSDRSPSSELW